MMIPYVLFRLSWQFYLIRCIEVHVLSYCIFSAVFISSVTNVLVVAPCMNKSSFILLACFSQIDALFLQGQFFRVLLKVPYSTTTKTKHYSAKMAKQHFVLLVLNNIYFYSTSFYSYIISVILRTIMYNCEITDIGLLAF